LEKAYHQHQSGKGQHYGAPSDPTLRCVGHTDYLNVLISKISKQCNFSISIQTQSRELLVPKYTLLPIRNTDIKVSKVFYYVTLKSFKHSQFSSKQFKKSLNDILCVTAIQICRSMPFINYYNRMDKVTQEARGSGDYKPCNISIECDRRSLVFNSSTTQEELFFQE
jgi:hypothetical protein